MNNLEEIQKYWENNSIYKEAGGVGKALDKVLGLFGKALGKTVDILKDDIAKPAIVSLPISAVLAAVAWNKLKSPTVVAKNMDRRLLLNTLDTEIAVARRQIADIEAKRAKTDNDAKPYDRFV